MIAIDSMVAAIALASVRLWALLRVQASWKAVLGRRWEWIAAALAIGLAGIAAASGRLALVPVDTLGSLAIAAVFELALGSALGLAVALLGYALVGAAREAEHNLELRESSTLSTLLLAASLAVGLSLGLHRPLLAGLLGSFDAFALASPRAWMFASDPVTWLIERAAAATGLALALATPVLLTRTVIELGVGSLARPGFEAASLTAAIVPGLRCAAALLALGAAWSAYPEAFARGL